MQLLLQLLMVEEVVVVVVEVLLQLHETSVRPSVCLSARRLSAILLLQLLYIKEEFLFFQSFYYSVVALVWRIGATAAAA